MTIVSNTQIQIDKSALSNVKVVNQDIDSNALEHDEVLLKIESFGFSANNITYALMGDMMGYWGFFPAEEGYGILPIWGFATVEASRCDEVKVGEKVFGYLPLSSHLVIKAGNITRQSFYDVSEKRKSISPVYDQYVRTAVDPGYDPKNEDWQLNFRPLFMTSFVLDDFVSEQITSSTKTVVLTSASSKTAYGAGFLLKHHAQQRGVDYKVVGLTSKGNIAFTKESGCYDQVLSYDEYNNLSNQQDTIVLDFAGNKPLLLNIQEHLGDAMQSMIYIGVTDVKSQMKKFEGELKGHLFFAPSQVKKRTEEWGGQGFMQKYAAAWMAFAKHIHPLLSTDQVQGIDAICHLYVEGLQGNFDTRKMYQVRF
ncbi:MAG: DUF2855 family protein [Aliiglaciecola sp.]